MAISLRRLLPLFFVLPSCLLDFDAVGVGGGGGGAGGHVAGGSGEGGRLIACDDASSCLEVPAEFTGPVRLSQDPACDEATLVFQGGRVQEPDTITVGPTECSCDCVQPAVAGCPDVTLAFYQLSNCTTALQNVMVPDGQCAQAPANKHSIKVVPAGGDPTASCVGEGVRAVLAPVEFVDPVFGCDDDLPACSNGACIPNADRYCVVSATASDCPAGFPVGFEIARDDELEDTRSCECNCDTLTGTCVPDITIYSDAACGTELVKPLTACVHSDTNALIVSAKYQANVTGAQCTGLAVPSGDVKPQNVLACCTAE